MYGRRLGETVEAESDVQLTQMVETAHMAYAAYAMWAYAPFG
jgi:hypothetical protein